jgi:hypothetical protein
MIHVPLRGTDTTRQPAFQSGDLGSFLSLILFPLELCIKTLSAVSSLWPLQHMTQARPPPLLGMSALPPSYCALHSHLIHLAPKASLSCLTLTLHYADPARFSSTWKLTGQQRGGWARGAKRDIASGYSPSSRAHRRLPSYPWGWK